MNDSRRPGDNRGALQRTDREIDRGPIPCRHKAQGCGRTFGTRQLAALHAAGCDKAP